VSLSDRQRAVVLAMRDLEATDGKDTGWDTASVQVAAGRYPGGTKVDDRTIRSLEKRCVVVRRRLDNRIEFTEAGRARLREGLR
jgi:hypothetical protein